jgi:hypothetical protein
VEDLGGYFRLSGDNFTPPAVDLGSEVRASHRRQRAAAF